MEKGTRIQKVLSEQGIASRRKAEEWIEQGNLFGKREFPLLK